MYLFELIQKHVAAHLRPTTGSLEFTCKEAACGKQFRDTMALRRHELLHDNGLIDCYFCPWRGNPYQNVDIESHFNSHAGQKNHCCDFCGAKFTKKSNLRQHLEHKHERKADRYKCEKCDFKTHSSQLMWVHKNKCSKLWTLE